MTKQSFTKEEFKLIRDFIEASCGISLGDHKEYLLENRLSKLLTESGCKTYKEFYLKAKNEPQSGLRDKIVDAMATNETMWFRDTYPFEVLKRHLLPELGSKSTSALRIWSAACSSGQETYSISMTVSEFSQSNPGALRRKVEIVGTDISPSVLTVARSGVYDDMSVARGLSEERRQRFFRQRDKAWELNTEIRGRTRFTDLNLLGSYALMGRFDIIFCRNVLIYFSADIKRNILTRMAQALNPGGYIFVGGSESPTGYCDAFEMVRLKEGVVYKRKENWKPS